MSLKSPFILIFLFLFYNNGVCQFKETGKTDQLYPLELSAVATGSKYLEVLKFAFNALDLGILKEAHSFTIFAPNDASLIRKSDLSIKTLLRPENEKALFSFVTYHMVAGKLTAASILRAMSRGNGIARFRTVQGNELIASMEGTDIVLTDCFGNKAKIMSADKYFGTSVVHIIDNVIRAN